MPAIAIKIASIVGGIIGDMVFKILSEKLSDKIAEKAIYWGAERFVKSTKTPHDDVFLGKIKELVEKP